VSTFFAFGRLSKEKQEFHLPSRIDFRKNTGILFSTSAAPVGSPWAWAARDTCFPVRHALPWCETLVKWEKEGAMWQWEQYIFASFVS
jgi:hypothetical protein